MVQWTNSKTEFYIIVFIVLVITLGILFVVPSFLPGPYDTFAKCLTEKKLIFYGAFWCPHCAAQKELLGNSMKYITYVECSTPDFKKTPVCLDNEIVSYPTWKLSDRTNITGVQPLENLSRISGCQLDEKT